MESVITSRDAGVFDHVLQSVLGEAGVQRHVGGAGLEDAQQRGHQVGAAGEAYAHQHAGADAARLEQVGEAVGAGFECGVGQGHALGDQGDRVRRGNGLAADPLFDARVLFERHGGGGVPGDQARSSAGAGCAATAARGDGGLHWRRHRLASVSAKPVHCAFSASTSSCARAGLKNSLL